MSMKLYVGNLPESMTDDQLKTIFAEAGPVASAKVIMDRYTGQPRGFGFVEMETKSDGQRAISMFNGKDVDGNSLKVNEARPPAKGGGRFGGRRWRRRRSFRRWRRRWWPRRRWRPEILGKITD